MRERSKAYYAAVQALRDVGLVSIEEGSFGTQWVEGPFEVVIEEILKAAVPELTPTAEAIAKKLHGLGHDQKLTEGECAACNLAIDQANQVRELMVDYLYE